MVVRACYIYDISKYNNNNHNNYCEQFVCVCETTKAIKAIFDYWLPLSMDFICVILLLAQQIYGCHIISDNYELTDLIQYTLYHRLVQTQTNKNRSTA